MCFSLVFSNLSNAQSGSPFTTRNQSPLSLIYGIPTGTPPRLLEENNSRWINSLNISNTLIAQGGTNDQLFVDLETWQLNLFYDYGFKQNWMLRFHLPVIAHTGGILDKAIDSYHKALGLPQGLQPGLPYNQISVDYTQDNTSQLNISSNQKDIGDIAFQLAWQVKKSNDIAISYWTSLKLPTGDYKKLTGSGGTDIAAWAAMDYRLNDSRWLFGQAGLLYMHNNKVLPDIHNNWGTFAMAGIKFQPWNPVELKTQLEFHSALFDTNIEFMQQSYQLTFGGSYLINTQQKLDFAVGEDIKTGTSPDVSFNISWWINF